MHCIAAIFFASFSILVFQALPEKKGSKGAGVFDLNREHQNSKKNKGATQTKAR